ncbi:MAG: hypothetical protein RR547_12510 [Raoultibacter sp.]
MGTVKTTAGKGALFALAIAVAALLLTGLTACGGEAPEDIIRKGVTEELESIKNLDQAALDEIVAGAASSGTDFEEYGISMDDFARTWLSGFDYTVDSVTVNGEDATATVTVTCKSLMEGVNIWLEKATEAASDPAIASLPTDELNKKIGSLLLESIGAAPTETNTVDLPYVLNGNTWEPGPGFDTALSQAFAAGAI